MRVWKATPFILALLLATPALANGDSVSEEAYIPAEQVEAVSSSDGNMQKMHEVEATEEDGNMLTAEGESTAEHYDLGGADRRAYLTIGAGSYDLVQTDDTAAIAHLEYRFADRLWVLTPFLGLGGTTDGAVYGYFGLGYDWRFADNWYLFPNTAVGGYHHGSGKDLGYGLEFRSGLELGYIFESEDRLGIAFHHLSNASLGSDNPGTETLIVNYSFAF